MSRYRALICLALTHGLVDSYAMLTEPLWPRFRTEFALTQQGLLWLLTVKMLTPNFSQGVFGYLRDRHRMGHLLWLGPLVGVLGMTAIGFTAHGMMLAVCLCVGMAGIGAFHPEAAVAAGSAIEGNRTRGISVFMFGGTIGLGVGPMVGGYLMERYGLASVTWLMIPGALLILLLTVLSGPQRAQTFAKERPAHRLNLKDMLAGRGKLAAYLLFVGAFRVVPNVGMTQALAFTLDSQGANTQSIGFTQSVFLISGSLGMLLVATQFRNGWERASMIICPLCGIPLLMLLGGVTLSYPALLTILMLCGIIFNGTTPAMVSYGHQLFPNGAGFASALTMGVSWGISGLLVAFLTSYLASIGHPEWLYFSFVPCMAICAAGACFLPAPDELASLPLQAQPASN